MSEIGFLKYNYGNDMFGDSALKRYNRYHNCGSTWIFNTSLNGSNSYGTGCNCGCGYGVGSFFGSGLRGLLGMGLGALAAGGIYSVGRWIFNGGLKGLLGGKESKAETENNPDTKLGKRIKGNSTKKSSKDENVTKISDNDYLPLIKFGQRASALIANKPDLANKEAVDNYNSKIDALIKEIQDYKLSDDVHSPENNQHKENIIKSLRGAKAIYTPAVSNNESNPGSQEPSVTPVVLGENEFSINGKNLNIGDISDLDGLTNDDVEALLDDRRFTPDKAKAILGNLGYIDNEGLGKMSGDYRVLLLLQHSGINVKCAMNSASEDKFVIGRIGNVEKDDQNMVSYTVDNSVAEGDHGLIYSFKQVSTNEQGQKVFNLSSEPIKPEEQGDYKRKDETYLDNDYASRDYVLVNEKEPMQITGDPVVSSWARAGYTELEKEEE